MMLTAAHRRMLLEDSAISEAIAAARGYRSLTAFEATQILPPLGFSAPVCGLGAGLLFPLTLPEDPVPLYQFRPDKPRRNDDGKPIKYEIPHHRKQRLILHPSAATALRSGATPLFISEGVKKVDSLLSRGATAVGGIGVWSFTVPRTAAEKKRGTPKVLLPDWQGIHLQDRRVVLVFDSDAAFNTDVDQAEQELAGLLRARGAQVVRIRLPMAPDGRKQGIDDFFACGHSLADALALIEPMPRPRFATISAPALYAKELPPARYVIPGKLPVGATLFFGRGKDGKSLLVWNLALATATGGKALGAWDVEPGDVLYLALEDGERRGQQRLFEQMLAAGMTEPPARLELQFWSAPRIGEGFLERLDTWVDEHPEGRLVIIDILEKVRPVRTRNGVYQDDYQALEALQTFGQQRNIAILVVHHSNKSKPEDFRDSANGSMGLTGAADTLWSLHRVAGAPDATLKIIGREVEQQDLALQFQDGFWTVLGDAADYRLSKESREVLEALTQAGRPLTPKQLATRLAQPAANVRMRLKRMLDRGEVLNDGDGYLPRSSPPPSPERAREREQSTQPVTPVTPVTGVTGVTPVTLGQNGIHGHGDRATEASQPRGEGCDAPRTPGMSVTSDNPEACGENASAQASAEASQRNRGVTGGGVTLFASVTPHNNGTCGDEWVSVTGVTGVLHASPNSAPQPRCRRCPDAPPVTEQRMADGSVLIRCTGCRKVVDVREAC